MKRGFAALVLVMLFIPIIIAKEITPITTAEEINPDLTSVNLRSEIQKKLDGVDIEESSLPKLGFLLPILIEIRATDTDEVYYLELSKTKLLLVDDPEKDPNLIIKATSSQLREGFSSKDDNFGGVISQFAFDPQSFKGSLLTVALEVTYGTELLPDPSFSEKVMRKVIGWFV